MIPFAVPALSWQAKALLLIALFLVGLACGMRLSSALYAEKRESALQTQLGQLEAVRAFDGVLQNITGQSSDRLANSVVPRGTVTIQKEVIKYVKDRNHAACLLDPDWVRIYNRSLLPEVPAT